MGFNYTKTQKASHKLLKKFGRPGEIRAYLDTGFDPIEGTISPTEYVQTFPKLLSVPSVSAGFKYYDQGFLSGLATGQTKIFLVDPTTLDFVPEVGHQVLFEDKLWDIGTEDENTGVMPLSPLENFPLLYTVGARLSGRDPDDGSVVLIGDAPAGAIKPLVGGRVQ